MKGLQNQTDHQDYQKVSNNLWAIKADKRAKEEKYHVQTAHKCASFRTKIM